MTLGGRVGALFAGLATQSLLAWILGANGRGSLAVCLSFAAVLAVVFTVGCDISATFFVASKKLTLSEGVSCALVYAATCSVVAMTVGWLLMQLPVSFFAKASPEAFMLALLFIPASLFRQVFHQMLTFSTLQRQ